MLTGFKHIDSLESHDLVYNISCNDCDANYWGNTKIKLETKVKEHKSAFNKPFVHSNIAEHSFATKHDINWKNPKIIFHEPNQKAIFFLENSVARHNIAEKISRDIILPTKCRSSRISRDIISPDIWSRVKNVVRQNIAKLYKKNWKPELL
jgi:hypothetical protein